MIRTSPEKSASTREISREPKPLVFGSDTAGPPLSCQTKFKACFPSSVLVRCQDILTRPTSFESAPYLVALVASSC